MPVYIAIIMAVLGYSWVAAFPVSAEPSEGAAASGYRLVSLPLADKTSADSLCTLIREDLPKAAVTRVRESRSFYRLIAGRFNDLASARQAQAVLSGKNVPSMVMQSKGRFTVLISSFLAEQRARDEQRRLAAKGITATITRFNQATDQWQVNSGDDFELREAVYAASLMSLKDVVTIIK